MVSKDAAQCAVYVEHMILLSTPWKAMMWYKRRVGNQRPTWTFHWMSPQVGQRGRFAFVNRSLIGRTADDLRKWMACTTRDAHNE